MPDVDPITAVHRALWKGYLANANFIALVKPGNRRDTIDPNFVNFKMDAAPGDLPEVILVQGEMKVEAITNQPGLVNVDKTYRTITTTDRINPNVLNMIVCACMQSLYDRENSEIWNGTLCSTAPGLQIREVRPIAKDLISSNAAPDSVPTARGTLRSINLLDVIVGMTMEEEQFLALQFVP